MGCGVVVNPSSPPLNINITKFALGHIIGRGEYGIVKSGLYLPKKLPVAIKQLPFHKILSHKSGFTLPFLELEILKLTYDHPNIINLKFAFIDHNNCYFIFDHMTGGDLRYHLRNHISFTEYGIAYIIGCLSSALHFLHQQNIIHRDIKPENILLDSCGRPYLTDFGISYIDPTHLLPITSSSSGTRCYSAPEIFTTHHRHSYHADYWSLGILTYELIFNERPFHDLCPSHFVQFVELEYTSMWNELENLNRSFSSSPSSSPDPVLSKENIDWNYYKNLPIPQSILESSELSLIELRNRQFMISSSSSSGSTKISQTHQLEPTPDLILQQLPSNYIIPIPRYTLVDLEISETCRDFLSKLLDIRIPHRLGTRSSKDFNELLEHSWFVNNYITQEKILYGTLLPEFIPNESQVSSQVFMEFPENLFHSDMFPTENIPVKLSKEIRQRLEEFRYVSPIMMQSLSYRIDETVNIKSSTQQEIIPYPPHQYPQGHGQGGYGYDQEQDQNHGYGPDPGPGQGQGDRLGSEEFPSSGPYHPLQHTSSGQHIYNSLESFEETDGLGYINHNTHNTHNDHNDHDHDPQPKHPTHQQPHTFSLHKSTTQLKNQSTFGMSLSADYSSIHS